VRDGRGRKSGLCMDDGKYAFIRIVFEIGEERGLTKKRPDSVRNLRVGTTGLRAQRVA